MNKMNSKGLQLSINFLVLLILATVMFIYSVNFIYGLFEKTSELEKLTFDNLDKQVESLTCRTEQVCLGVARKTIARGSFKVFGLRVLNSKDNPTKFLFNVEQSIGPSELNFQPRQRDFTLNPGDLQSFGIGIEVPNNAESGNYVFDVKVYESSTPMNLVPYGEQEVYKINVIVP